ncbi:MAG: hypothetical protein D6B28_06210 [Gammaproteobacteria bacterium]|nr:MAG: hypothetical protein D6B28_06210 [Gammaproteobacteria bacterium]
MAKIYCKYHPKDPARKYCPHCNSNLCSKCIKPETAGSNRYLCPVCKNEVNDLGMENVITPFWERIPQFFKYPFNFDSMVYVIGLSLISFLTYLPIVGFAVYIAIVFAMYRYGFALLQFTARGYVTPEETAGGARLNTSSNMHIIFFGITLLFGLLVGVVPAWLQSPSLAMLSIIAIVIFVLLIPAIIMTIGVTESFSQSINPLAWFVIVKSIGIHYLTLLFFLMILNGGSSAAIFLISPFINPMVILPLFVLFNTYFLMVMFLMMGYVIYQYHERLGVTVDKDADEDSFSQPQTAENITDSILHEVSILIQEGMFDDAKAKLKQALIRHSMELKLHDQYHKLLVKTNDKAELVAHAKGYIPALIANNQFNQLIESAEQALQKDKNFRPEKSIHAITIAEHAFTSGKHKFALQILDKFDQFYPMDANIPKAGLLMCKALCDGLGEDAKAKKILQAMLGKYPDGEVADQMREYMKFIDSLLETVPE